MDQNRIPKPGQIYRHFKNKLYQIITVATHSETREQMVVYQALYGNFKTYVRPLDMFLEEVDTVKYPEAMQKYRFEQVELREDKNSPQTGSFDATEYKGKDREDESNTLTDVPKAPIPTVDIINSKHSEPIAVRSEENLSADLTKQPTPEEESGSINPVLLAFLEAGSYEEKLAILMHKKKFINDKILNDMAVSIDCTLDEGDIEERIMEFAFCLQTHARFENRRLR